MEYRNVIEAGERLSTRDLVDVLDALMAVAADRGYEYVITENDGGIWQRTSTRAQSVAMAR